MVAQSQQLVNVVAKIDPTELQRRIDQGKNAKRQALAKREENKRNGVKPRELKLPPPPFKHKEIYVDRELRKTHVENTLGQKIVDTIIEITSKVAPPKTIKAMATKGRDDKGHFVAHTKKAEAESAYELVKLTHLAD